jgi:hypothetical protein
MKSFVALLVLSLAAVACAQDGATYSLASALSYEILLSAIFLVLSLF